MEAIFAIAIGFLTACGVFLALRGQTFQVVLGLTFLSYAVNLFLFVMGRLVVGAPPVIAGLPAYTDPLPQALVLTAIVISFGMTAFVIVLALKARAELGNDHVDGIETGHEKIHDTRRHNEIGDTRQRDKGGVKPRRDKGGDTRHREDAR